MSVFNITIDGQLRTNPPVHPGTLGCVLEYIVSAAVRQITSPAKLVELAPLII